MVARLPQPGSDDGTWGDLLNEFLSVSLDSNGLVKSAQLPQASSTVQGVVQLTNDLGGTSSVPTVPGLATKVDVTAITAKGDIIVGADTNVPTALTVGSDGQVLTADHNEDNGLKWATPSANNGNELAWNGTDYVPADLKADTSKPRTFKGPVDPSTVDGVTMNANDWFDTWVGGA